MKYGIVSLYANPLHEGHLEYIEAVHSRCNHVIAIVNNDEQVKLKGSKPFMDARHRHRIVGALTAVGAAIISSDVDDSVAETLRFLHTYLTELHKTFHNGLPFEMTFYNSGDRPPENQNKKELDVCEELGISTEYIQLPKKFSSSELLS